MMTGAFLYRIRSFLSPSRAAIALAVALFGGFAQAQSVALNNSLTAPNAKKWTLPLILGTESTLHSQDAYERSATTAVTVVPTYRLTDTLTASMTASVYKEETNPYNSGFGNTSLALTHRWKLTDETSWKNGMSVVLPTNRQAQDQTSFQGAAGLSTGLTFSNLWLDSTLGYKLSFLRNSHEFDRSADDAANIREALSQTVDLSLPVFGDFSLEGVFIYTQGLTYQNDTRHKFATGVDLVWSATRALSLSVGTSNAGEALKPNGYQSNIEFFDEKTSVVSFGLTYVL